MQKVGGPVPSGRSLSQKRPGAGTPGPGFLTRSKPMPATNSGDKNTSPRTERTAPENDYDPSLAELRATATHLAAEDGPLAPDNPDFDAAFELVNDLTYGLADYERRHRDDSNPDDSEADDSPPNSEPPTDGELCDLVPDPELTVLDLDAAGVARTVHDSTAPVVANALFSDEFPEDCKPVRYGSLVLQRSSGSTWSITAADGAGEPLDFVAPTRYKSMSDLQADLERLDWVVRRITS